MPRTASKRGDSTGSAADGKTSSQNSARIVVVPDLALVQPDEEAAAIDQFLDRNHAAWSVLQADYGPLHIARLISPKTRDAIREIVDDIRATRSGYRWPAFADFLLIEAPESSDLAAIAKRLRAWDDIQTAYIYAEGVAPEVVVPTAANGYDPNFYQQAYLRPGPVGVGAECVWPRMGGRGYLGADGDGMALVDIESGFHPDHEDLAQHFRPAGPNPRGSITGFNNPVAAYHGTAVLGIICARNNDKGGCGIVPNLSRVALASTANPTPPPADLIRSEVISQAIHFLRSDPGAVILIEIQLKNVVGIPYGSPVELLWDDYIAIQLACDRGFIVVEPAGNGENDLDQLVQPPMPDINRCPSGAIMVAASGLRTTFFPNRPKGAPTRSHVPLQNAQKRQTSIGTRIDCFAHGENNFTCDYQFPPVAGQANNSYCSNFGKTSAASAIIAGVALSVQGMAKARLGRTLKPAEMRWLLKNPNLATLSERGLQDKIGVMPDLAKIDKLLKKYSPKTLRWLLP